MKLRSFAGQVSGCLGQSFQVRAVCRASLCCLQMPAMFDFDDLQQSEQAYLEKNPLPNARSQGKKNMYRKMAREMFRQNVNSIRERDVPVGQASYDEAAGEDERQEKLVPVPVIGPSDQMAIILAAVQAARAGEMQARGSAKPGVELDTVLFLQPGVVHPFHPGHPDLAKITKAVEKRFFKQ